MALADRKQNRVKKRLMNRSPRERFEWLITLKSGTDCILKVEEKYRIYRRMEDEFAELAELSPEDAGDFSKMEECRELSLECGRIADAMKAQLPETSESTERTVMMSAGERQAEDRRQDGGSGIVRWILLALLVLGIAFVVCYKIPVTRVIIGDMEAFVNLNSLAVKSYRVGGDVSGGWEKAVSLEQEIISQTDIGHKVKFGKLDWIVLEHKDSETVLIANEPLKDICFNTHEPVSADWGSSSLRHYLNNRFLKNNFYMYEESAMSDSPLDADDSSTLPNKVYIPSESDIDKYEDILKTKVNNLRLVDPGENEGTTEFVSAEGDIISYGFPVDQTGCYVRPMIRVRD
ncbi:MAG TPA: hypothetical protein DCP06_05935 [Lachnospiraceae bacterium]|nr:hypothetical protein [Lachnospiraceae bacterium]